MRTLKVVRVAVVVLAVEFPICMSRVMVARCSSVNAMRFIRFHSEQAQGPELQQQEQVQAVEREQDRALEPVVDGVASTSTFAFASIVRPSGRRCSTMVGAR
jgi:hypothetical protein